MYIPHTRQRQSQVLREIAQEIALAGLWRGKVFEHVSFYGGTALRIVFGLDRYSEDMDFTLDSPNPDFSLAPYLPFVERELRAYGFDVSIQRRISSPPKRSDRAFLKMNTRVSMLTIGVPRGVVETVAREQLLKVKLEVDVDPPQGASTTVSFVYRPQAFSIRTYDLPSMFAGKFIAAVARARQSRIKGRDWYDVVWFVSRNIPVSLVHVRSRLIQTGHLDPNAEWNDSVARTMMVKKIDRLDIESARKDVFPFLRNRSAVEVWSREFFHDVARRMRFV